MAGCGSRNGSAQARSSAGVSGGVGAATTKIWRASFASFKVGDEEVRNLKLFITDRLIDNDMLLGADFFISHRVLVSNSQHRIYLTYEGGPVFNSAVEAHERDRDGKGEHKVEASLSAEADPTDADGFSRRGMAAFSRNEIDKALADLNKAVDMAPQEPRYLLERARIQAGAKKVFLAMADLDAAIRLKPDEVDALIARARLKIGGNDAVSALTDLDAASRVLPKQADARLTLADMYDRVDKPDLALMQADLWVENHPDNPMLGHALNTRCWARAILGVELDKALHDCDRAVNLQPRVAAPLVNRGLVHLRRQEWQAALKDDEAALAINPRAAWALYGRGTARARLGEAEAGEADVKAAHALWSRLDEQIKRYNLAP